MYIPYPIVLLCCSDGRLWWGAREPGSYNEVASSFCRAQLNNWKSLEKETKKKRKSKGNRQRNFDNRADLAHVCNYFQFIYLIYKK